jgi:hypothetical protein
VTAKLTTIFIKERRWDNKTGAALKQLGIHYFRLANFKKFLVDIECRFAVCFFYQIISILHHGIGILVILQGINQDIDGLLF